jgi:DNA polymerase-3 subunit beta
MKFVCERSVLLKEISVAQEIVSSKNVISILSNIYLEAENDSLIIKATDLKVNFETKIPVTVMEPGFVTVFGDKFLNILASGPEGEIEFEFKDGKFIIKTLGKKSKTNLKSMASDKFPEFPVSGAEYFQFSVKNFKEMVKQTVFAVSDDENRFYMNGIFLEKREGKLIMVATDGRRLAYISKEADQINDFNGVIVPPKILNIITKRAGDEGMIEISITDKIIFVRFGSYSLSSVLFEGQFPNYRKVIPEEQVYNLTVSRVEIMDALRLVSQMVEQKSHRIYLGIKPDGMKIYSEETETGDSEDEIPCKYEGEEISLAVNYRYIEEPLKVMNNSEICFRFSGNNKAITLIPVPETDFFHIIMPMHS